MAIVDNPADNQLEEFARRLKINFPILMSNDDLRKEFRGVVIVLTAILIDKKGAMVKKYTGHLNKNLLSPDINLLLQHYYDEIPL